MAVRKLAHVIGTRSYIYYSNYAKWKTKRTSIIWQFSTPKSASSFLHLVLSNILSKQNIRTITPLPFGGDRYQEPCVIKTLHSNFFGLTHGVFSGHMNTKYSTFLSTNFLSSKHKKICQTRSIVDTVASLYDYVPKQRLFGFFKVGMKEWDVLEKEERYDLIIQQYVPWHIDFLVSWKGQSEHDILWILYKDWIAEPESNIAEILNYCNIPTNTDVISKALEETINLGDKVINRNVGEIGRGKKELTSKQQERIAEMIDCRKGTGISLFEHL